MPAVRKYLVTGLSLSIKNDRSSKNLKRWSAYIISKNISLQELIGILKAEQPTRTYFSWMPGGLCELKPEIVFSVIPILFKERQSIDIKNFDRSLAKMFWLCGVPEDIEGSAMDEMFRWLLDSEINVATKNYALSALFNLCHKYEELKGELKFVIEDQLGKNKSSFDKRAHKILEKLEHRSWQPR